MSDALHPLVEQLRHITSPALWVADENHRGTLAALAKCNAEVHLLSNRFDIVSDAVQAAIPATFSDFHFADCSLPNALQHVFYRVSKERPVTNHLINSAFNLLPSGGVLWLSGHKNEGIKTYFKQAAALFGSTSRAQKNGDVYWGKLVKSAGTGAYLDDRDYQQLRPITLAGQDTFLSKPGTYGWDKIDKGSELLATVFKTATSGQDHSSEHLLDLGCGYGYLTMQCKDLAFASITATDNNAAALRCVQANAARLELSVAAVADDCGKQLAPETYDVILCNPPFHQGFAVDSQLTDKFLRSAHRLLRKQGQAWFVVNAFIPLEQKAKAYFSAPNAVTLHTNNGQFKVVSLTKG